MRRLGKYRLTRVLAALVGPLALAACIQVQPYLAKGVPPATKPVRVLLMPPNVAALELTTAAAPLPRADWTELAQDSLVEAVADTLKKHGAQMIRYRRATEVMPYAEDHLEAIALHEAVLQTILTYRYAPAQQRAALPTKPEGLDWTLGESVTRIKTDYAADYALFLTYRQATSTVERALFAVVSFVLFGFIQPTSQSIGLASLVDLNTGAIIWTNLLQGQSLDVNRPDGIRDRVEQLLSGLPL
ncbi:hypothetical protein NB231_03185 [Nitrococcus mobilis Nb-231]|uniref:Lipoprotein n=2 Tax=Nitrococcus mobilis TaxID=35797 RepID=A4BR78_9GAMM|nr:hypothetical protein NB231_03185 [Nitrococcus mobilis Nb-231]